jgi:VanZ family protein
MKLSHRSLHAARIVDTILLWPALALVIWGELTRLDPEASWPINDKLVHFLAYFSLGVMAAAALKHRRAVILAVLGLIVLGGALEIMQDLVGRDTSFLDEVANTAGAVSGAVLARLVIEPLRRRFAAEEGGS